MKPPTLAIPSPAPAKSINFRPHNASAGRHVLARPTGRIRVLLADDHPVALRGMAACLERHANMQVVGEAADGQEALLKARALVPDVVLADIDMPRLTGLDLTEALRKELPQIKVLLLSMHNNAEFVRRGLKAGANGYILKQASPEELVQAVETVNAGQPFFSPDAARLALNQIVRGHGEGPDPSDLTSRERQVLTCVAEGMSNKEIACRFNIATRTAETHRERLMRKLDIHSIAGLTRFAIAKGLVAMPELAVASG